MNNQKTHWDKLHEAGKVDYYSENSTYFAKEVVKIIPEKSKVLELGCGVGNDSNFFVQIGHHVLATDFSDIAIDKNKQRYKQDNLQFEVLDISKPMKFPNNEFDVVYARLSLHYFTDRITKNIFQEINRILKPNGFLCYICKSVNDPLYGKGNKIEKDMYDENGHVRHFFSEEYAKKCLRNNFMIDKLEIGAFSSRQHPTSVRCRNYLYCSDFVIMTS